MVPAAVAPGTEDDLLDANVGGMARSELDPVVVRIDAVGEIPGDESRGREVERWRSERDSRERSDHRDSDDCGTPPFPRTELAQDSLLSLGDLYDPIVSLS